MKFRLPETLPLKAPLRQTRTELDRCGEIKYTFIHYVMRQMTWHVRTGWKRGGRGWTKKEGETRSARVPLTFSWISRRWMGPGVAKYNRKIA